MNRLYVLLSLLVLVVHEPAPADEKRPHVTDIVEIPIKDGINRFKNLTQDGHDGIVMGWRDNGNAHGYARYMVLVDMGPKASAPYFLATVDTHDAKRGEGTGELDTIRNDPHTGEDMVSTVKFVHAKVDGAPATILVIATRDLSNTHSIGDETPVDVEFYRMVHKDGDIVGWPPYYFDLMWRQRLKGTNDNAECALAKEFGLKLIGGWNQLCGH